jgi:hypothetical protein
MCSSGRTPQDRCHKNAGSGRNRDIWKLTKKQSRRERIAPSRRENDPLLLNCYCSEAFKDTVLPAVT